MLDPKKAAFLLIDMQEGFIDPVSSLCVAEARASVPACARGLAAARNLGMKVVHVRRRYAEDGSDVEPVRVPVWLDGGRPLSNAWPESLLPPAELAEHAGEQVLWKPSFSAFFGTGLAETLEEEGIRTVVIAGTTTPNCVRSTCYDALSHGFNTVILADATSSRTSEVQSSNLSDMAFIGATIMDAHDLATEGLRNVPDTAAEARRLLALA